MKPWVAGLIGGLLGAVTLSALIVLLLLLLMVYVRQKSSGDMAGMGVYALGVFLTPTAALVGAFMGASIGQNRVARVDRDKRR